MNPGQLPPNSHLQLLMSQKIRHSNCGKPAFSLIEMAAVMAVLVILTASGVRLLNGTSGQSRRAGADLLVGMIEQARAAAITSRSYVVLAVAEPADLPENDERCRLGLFRVETWPEHTCDPIMGVLMNRWRSLDSGVVLIAGAVDGVANPLDGDGLTLSHGTPRPLIVKVHAIAFNSRGALHYPLGSTPVVMRIAEGVYQHGKATPNRRGESGTITETRLKIGRVTSRPYRIDG
ncbi:MAG: prepilin-type N-terminal cleavage/methylation domain-containing protein [Verrucomicrobia bacterium]|nr:prepilin-type N-terminal cleavage/methylation domain-containing protein [Verrucomicrobiota bacterium]